MRRRCTNRRFPLETGLSKSIIFALCQLWLPIDKGDNDLLNSHDYPTSNAVPRKPQHSTFKRDSYTASHFRNSVLSTIKANIDGNRTSCISPLLSSRTSHPRLARLLPIWLH